MRKPNLLGLEKKVIAGLKDYYETTMADTFIWMNDHGRKSTFNLAVRGLRDHKVVSEETIEKDGKQFAVFEIEKNNYLLSCGQEQAIAYILNYELTDELLEMYERKGISSRALELLKNNRTLDVDVYGIEEGVPVFGHEPILSVTGGFEEVQFPETLMLSAVGYQTAVATTASYIRNIQKEFGREDIVTLEGGSRRCVSPLHASKAAIVGGMKGTSLEQLGVEYPELEARVGGSAGHSAVLHAGGDEKAFEKQLRAYFALEADDSDEVVLKKIRSIEERSTGPTFLLDTFDSTEGLEVAIKISKKYDLHKFNVRTDSGDPLERTKYIRGRLDEMGCEYAKIMVSDDLTASKIYHLLENDAPMDIILIGTYLVNPFKLPGPVYKCARDEQENGEVIDVCKMVKNNPSKATLPGRLEVYRVLSKEDGMADRDLILMAGEDVKNYLTEEDLEAVKLTKQFVEKGKQVYDFPKITEVEATREFWLNKIRPEYLNFKEASEYPVLISPLVEKAKEEYKNKIYGGEKNE